MKDSKLKRTLVSTYEYFLEKKRMFVLRTKYRLRIMSPDRTLAYIKKHKCSIARYGDGEIDIILEKRDLGFQKLSDDLKNSLIDILRTENKNLLVCISRAINTTAGCNDHSKTFWIEWGKKDNHHKEMVEMIRFYAGKRHLFGDTLITRPYIDWKTDKRAKRTFPKLMDLWKDRDVIIVEGEQTHLGIGNDLFSNAKSIKRILAPAVNAFDYCTEIKSKVESIYNGELVLIALGPTATVLASEFSKKGIQALDIGHIDIEYEWFLRGAKDRVAIPGKFTNEAKGGRVYSDCKDEIYLSQIVARIGC